MENLAELQRIRAVVDLRHIAVCDDGHKEVEHERTTNIPVTLTRRLATAPEDGCASFVVTLCCTFWNGRVTNFSTIAAAPAV
jgi:hypothetical protein